MTTADLTVHSCGFSSVPCKRTFDALPGTTYTGGSNKYLAHFEFWLFKDGVLIEESVGYGPQWGHVFTEAGDYECVLRVRCPGDADYSEDRWTGTFTTPTYDYEVYVDETAGDDGGAGTSGDPIQTLGEARTRLDANWVDSATARHAIHLKKGETWQFTGTWIEDSGRDRQGSLVIDAYSSGARPICWVTDGSTHLRRHNREHYALLGLDFRGDYDISSPTTTTDDIMLSNRVTTAGGGVRGPGAFLAVDCIFRKTRIAYYQEQVGGPTYATDDIDLGYYDSQCFQDCTVDETQGYQFLVEHVRHGFVKGCTLDRNYGSGDNDSRWVHAQHWCYIENSIGERIAANTSFRLHAGTTETEDADGTHSCTISGNVGTACTNWSIGPVPASGVDPGLIFGDFWFCRNKVDTQTVATPYGDSCLVLVMIDGVVVRNNQLSSIIHPISLGNGGTTDFRPLDNAYIDNNTLHSDLSLAGVSWGIRLNNPDITLTRSRNNISYGSVSGTGLLYLGFYGTPDADIAQIVSSDYNCCFQEAGTNNFYGDWPGLSPTSGTLAQWQSATTHDDNSVNTDPNIVDVTPGSIDLSIATGSSAIATGEGDPAAFVDYFGNLRDINSPCMGAHEFGSSSGPSAPTPGGGGGNIIEPAAASVTITGYAPQLQMAIPIPAATSTVTGYAPTVTNGEEQEAAAASTDRHSRLSVSRLRLGL